MNWALLFNYLDNYNRTHTQGFWRRATLKADSLRYYGQKDNGRPFHFHGLCVCSVWVAHSGPVHSHPQLHPLHQRGQWQFGPIVCSWQLRHESVQIPQIGACFRTSWIKVSIIKRTYIKRILYLFSSTFIKCLFSLQLRWRSHIREGETTGISRDCRAKTVFVGRDSDCQRRSPTACR